MYRLIVQNKMKAILIIGAPIALCIWGIYMIFADNIKRMLFKNKLFKKLLFSPLLQVGDVLREKNITNPFHEIEYIKILEIRHNDDGEYWATYVRGFRERGEDGEPVGKVEYKDQHCPLVNTESNILILYKKQ